MAVEPESIDLVQNAFESWWTSLGDDSLETRFSFETAIVEIAANVIEHSRRSEADLGRRFTLELSATDDRLTAVFHDNGMPSDIDLSAVSMADLEDEDGRGLALALLSLESLDYRHEDGRNVWTLVCQR
ncbi:ATP-binding protein [Frigoribacterium sp. RIT-PI-h]|uniref:ATP-binding protein n=2 Tax=Frigoribacterium sp. RIT-PI-h TaxID=1690245 RepID=UPI0013792B5B|nr:ATP-binding protein [Frigoribacterium sp. RIT-PI-h]